MIDTAQPKPKFEAITPRLPVSGVLRMQTPVVTPLQWT
jgi:hypothetical protein